MTLLFFDGFETYATGSWDYGTPGDAELAGDETRDVYMHDDSSDQSGIVYSVIASDRTPGAQLFQVVHGEPDNDLSTTLSWQFPLGGLSSSDTWIFGGAFRFPDGLNGASSYVHLFSFGSAKFVLRLRGNGDLLFQRVNVPNPTVTIDSAVGAISNPAEWNYIELKVKVHASAGTYDVRVNGTSVMSGSGVITSTNGDNRLYLVQSGHVQNKRYQLDDWYIADTAGAINNDFLNPDTTAGGNLFIQGPHPNAAGDSSQFSRSAGSVNYELVDEDGEDGDGTYVQSKTVGQKDLYHYENVDESTTDTIFGVIAKPVLMKTDGGSRTYRLLAKSGATEANSGTRYPNAMTYVRQAYVWETDPDTGVLWTPAGYNAAQFGLEMVS